MNLKSLVLGSAAIGIAAIAVGYLVAPAFMLANYGVTIDSINEASIIRSSYGGSFLGFSILFALGAVKSEYSIAGLVALLALMGGYAFGRLVSLVLDGVPGPLIFGLLGVEVFYAAAAAYLLVQLRSAPNNSLQARRP